MLWILLSLASIFYLFVNAELSEILNRVGGGATFFLFFFLLFSLFFPLFFSFLSLFFLSPSRLFSSITYHYHLNPFVLASVKYHIPSHLFHNMHWNPAGL